MAWKRADKLSHPSSVPDYIRIYWRAIAATLVGVILSIAGFYGVARSETQSLMNGLSIYAERELVMLEQWRIGQRNVTLLLLDTLLLFDELPDIETRNAIPGFMSRGQLKHLLWLSNDNSKNGGGEADFEIGTTNQQALSIALSGHRSGQAVVSSYYSREPDGLRLNVISRTPGGNPYTAVLGRNTEEVFSTLLNNDEAEFLAGVSVFDTELELPIYTWQRGQEGQGSSAMIFADQSLVELRKAVKQRIEVSLEVADRKLQVVFVPSESFLQSAYALYPWLVLLAGVLTTVLIGVMSFRAARERLMIITLQQRTTELAQSQSNLKLSEERYKLATEGAAAAVWDWNLKDGQFYASKQLFRMLGRANQPKLETASDFMELVHPDDIEQFSAALLAHLFYRETLEIDGRMAHSDGGYIWVRATGKAARDESGVALRLVGTMIDITIERRAHDDLLRSNQELDDFAYIASHDLKEPLRGIHNHARFLDEDYRAELGKDGKHRLDRMLYLTQRMEKLISDLLAYSRLNRVVLEQSEVHLTQVLRDIKETYAGVEDVRVQVTGDMPVLYCNPLRIEELFRNLVSNAVKYNTSEIKEVAIACKNVYPERNEHGIEFSVTDNGIGIEPEFHEDVFKIFKRLYTQDEFGGGTGSGLTFVKKIVEKYGGRIWLESAMGKGTRFTFTLPAAFRNSVAADKMLRVGTRETPAQFEGIV